jgi:hypothetical protein
MGTITLDAALLGQRGRTQTLLPPTKTAALILSGKPGFTAGLLLLEGDNTYTGKEGSKRD